MLNHFYIYLNVLWNKYLYISIVYFKNIRNIINIKYLNKTRKYKQGNYTFTYKEELKKLKRIILMISKSKEKSVICDYKFKKIILLSKNN